MKHSFSKILVIAVSFVSGVVLAGDNSARIAESRMVVKSFTTQLKGGLVSAMQSDGPVGAISACHIKAPEIAKKISAEKDRRIARTSLKTRNPDNTPDAWKKKVLQQFEQRKVAGESVEKMEYAEVLDNNGKRKFRYMKAIPTGGVCQTCHGKNIPPDIAEKLDELYPQDNARGFSLGDIRGAFTISYSID